MYTLDELALRCKLTETSDEKQQHSEAEKTNDEPKLAEDEDYESTEDDTDPSYTYCWPKVRTTRRATRLVSIPATQIGW